MLDLPVPEVEYHNIAVKPSQVQKDMVASLGERAEKIRGGSVDSSVDNMLKVTNDGRKLALDQRMMNPMLPDEEGSKVNACVNEVFRIWEENSDKKLTQILFCDLSTPKGCWQIFRLYGYTTEADRAWYSRSGNQVYPRGGYRNEETGAVQKGTTWRSANPDGQYAENGCGDECAEQNYCFPRH